MSTRRHVPLFVNLFAWGWMCSDSDALFGAAAVLLVVHLIQPFWSLHADRRRPVHRAFASGPLLTFAIDVAFLAFLMVSDPWGEPLTPIFVGILGIGALIALAFSALVMTLLRRR